MHRVTIFLVLLLSLGACKLPGVNIDPAFHPTVVPVVTVTPTKTLSVAYEQCGWNWATQSLPELSAEVQSALETAGLKGVTASVQAYGENCYSQDNEVLYFAAMETDFRISVEVEFLTDSATLGDLLEQILVVLDSFPPGVTPGSQPGYIGVRFYHGTEELFLWFSVNDSESARVLGLHGAALLDALWNR